MGAIINFLGKITGISKVMDMLNGYKSKIGAISLMLSGAAELTQRIVGLTDMASILAFLKGLPTSNGWLAIAAGIAAWGLAHKAEKAAAVSGADEPK